MVMTRVWVIWRLRLDGACPTNNIDQESAISMFSMIFQATCLQQFQDHGSDDRVFFSDTVMSRTCDNLNLLKYLFVHMVVKKIDNHMLSFFQMQAVEINSARNHDFLRLNNVINAFFVCFVHFFEVFP